MKKKQEKNYGKRYLERKKIKDGFKLTMPLCSTERLKKKRRQVRRRTYTYTFHTCAVHRRIRVVALEASNSCVEITVYNGASF